MFSKIVRVGKVILPCVLLCTTTLAFRTSKYRSGDIDPSQPCDQGFYMGLKVYLKDGATNKPITRDVRIEITDGSYKRMLTVPIREEDGADPTFIGAPERAGTYNVHVSCPGYISMIEPDVLVKRTKCHVIPTTLRLSLSPQ